MPVIGLLEGHRLRYRLGDPLVTPEAWAQSPGPAYQKDYATTDWEALYRANPASARSAYAAANAKSADPEYAPTVEDFFKRYFPTVSFDQPAITAPGTVEPPMLTPVNNAEAKAIADAARDAKYLPGPEVRYNPEACGGRAGEITCGPSNATGGGRGNFSPANSASTEQGTSKGSAFPILAALAAFLLVKG